MITVCIMSYGYAHLASHAVESVLAQTRKPDKILLVDDAKGDGIDKIGKMYGIETIVRKKNLGIVDNFNDTLQGVKTDKVMFLGADNYLRPDCLEKVDIDADIVSYDISIFGDNASETALVVGAENENGYYNWKFKPGDIETGNYIHGSSLYNTEMAKKFGYKASGNEKSEEDWMLWKAMLKNGAKHLHVQEALLYYRKHKLNFQK